jgi:hypothetical protein
VPVGLPTVEITCDNGKMFSTFVSGSDCAIIWDRNLKSRFHGALWLGTLDIRKVGCDTDFGQTLMEGALAWVLPPGQYEANLHAASVGRGGSSGQHARSSFGGGPSRVFSTTSSFRTGRPGLSESGRLETIRPAITEQTLRVPSAARPARQENDGDEVSSAVMKPAVRDNPEPENQSPTTAPIAQEARTVSAVDGRALFAKEEGKSGISSEGGLGPATGKGSRPLFRIRS